MGFPRAVPGKHRAPLQACRRSSQLHTAGGHRGAGFLVHSQYWRIQVLVPGYLLALLWITAGSACNRSEDKNWIIRGRLAQVSEHPQQTASSKMASCLPFPIVLGYPKEVEKKTEEYSKT